MKLIRVSAFTLIVLCCTLLSNATFAQSKSTQQQPSIVDQISNYVWGSNAVTKTYNNTKANRKVSVTIQDLSLSDMASMSGSLLSAFGKGGATLDVKEIAFAPDFNDGYYYLTFNTPEEETTKVILLDVSGKEIHNETIEEFAGGTYETKLNIPATAKGTYFLKIVQGFSLLNKKLVIE